MSVDFAPLAAARSAVQGAGQQASQVSQFVDSGQFAAALALLTGGAAVPQLGPAAAAPPVLVEAAPFAAGPAPSGPLAAKGTPGAAGGGPLVTGATGPAAPAAAGITGGAVVADARRYLGVPYRWGGTDPATGLDCSGLVQQVYGDLGIGLPRVSQQQAQAGSPVANLAAAQPGDLVFYEPGPTGPGHVGIYLGGGMMIDAPHTGTVVRIDPVGAPSSIRRILPGPISGPPGAVPAGTGINARPAPPAAYLPMFLTAAGASGVPPQLLAAVAQVESAFNPQAVSGAGAQGLMQLMPQTAAGLGVNPLDPAQAISGAARLLAADHAQFGSWPLAVAAYNAGGGAVQSYGGVPPYPETQAYVRQVLSLAGMSA